MSTIRNISQEAKHVNEMFPDIDYSVIVELLNECRSVDDVIEQILSGNKSIKWKKSKNSQKKQAQPQQLEQNSHNTTSNNNLIPPTPKISNHPQLSKQAVTITPKHASQGININLKNSKNNNNDKQFKSNKNINDTNKTSLTMPEISAQIKQDVQSLQSYDYIDDSFTSVINPTETLHYDQNFVQQIPNDQIFQKQFNYQNQDSFGSVLDPNNQSSQQQQSKIIEQKNYPVLTLPKDLLYIHPNMSRFGSFAGPITSNIQTVNSTLNYSSSNSAPNKNLYTSPPLSYNSASPKISLSSEENRFESFQSVITKDATTQLNNFENPISGSINENKYNIDNANDLNRKNSAEVIHQVKYQDLQYPGYSQYQMPYSPIYTQSYAQQIQPQPQLHQFQQQQIFQQQQLMMQNSNYQSLSQAQPQQVLSHQYAPSNPKFVTTQQQMASQYNFTMPYQKSQGNVVGNK